MKSGRSRIERRKFFKTVGVGVAAATLAAPSLAMARGNAGKTPTMDFEFAILDPIPLIPRQRIFEYTRESAVLYKDSDDKQKGRGVTLNSMAAVVAQLCDGTRNIETIIETTAKIFHLDEVSLRPRIVAFLRRLFEAGYLVFASPSTIPKEKMIRGLTLLNSRDMSLRMRMKDREIMY
ncbi:PqqD family protein [Geoalkalibacter halelectricus]|uniref:PqqD family protein n=1 Tax=Geoalkalibacter halelectricus TaxID=2847045 RepID=A0ABY5ZLJ4_9BACT|nr:PqqD family protein [Geoalkalibacter halelectricus]MDO3378969.1 PqqD family protein [Geoalkalibacter halelectricus]UWZ78785.1 PqqD family protein [Geoalkalibacter halelectricus]